MTLQDLPGLNACLNGTSATLLLSGYLFIRSGKIAAHRLCMLLALTTSAVFLVSYVYYHVRVGVVIFHGPPTIRAIYLTILFTHTVLAVTTVPLALLTATRALRGRFEAHRRIARIALPVWAYVSVTGVVVYWMLYRL